MFKYKYFLIGYYVYIYKTLIWPTWATTTGSHFQHTPNSNTAQDRSIWCFLRIIAISGPFWGLAHMINDHDHHADGAYRHCYHQGHFPSDPRRVILTRRHFSRQIFRYHFIMIGLRKITIPEKHGTFVVHIFFFLQTVNLFVINLLRPYVKTVN